MELGKEDIKLFIKEYEKNTVLWDRSHKHHFNKNKKRDAWVQIAKPFSISPAEAKKKMWSLLGSFRREKAKGKKTVGTGNGASEMYKSDWFAFKSFAFLMKKNDPRETMDSESVNENYLERDHSSDTVSPSDSISSKVNTDYMKDKPGENFVKPSSPKKKKRKSSLSELEKEDPRIQKAFEILQQPITPEDTTVKYSKYLADKLNQFDNRTKAILIHKINSLIFEAEMDKYSHFLCTPPSYSISHSPLSAHSTNISSPASSAASSPTLSDMQTPLGHDARLKATSVASSAFSTSPVAGTVEFSNKYPASTSSCNNYGSDSEHNV